VKTTIDTAGRIVVLKVLRDALDLRAGQPLAINAAGGRPETKIATTPSTLEERGRGVVAVRDTALPALTADLVRQALESVRR
jgi:bifunctional DNA-binding transcriptional regulator/antitoxin component of YhaV-PrlF toxin-antitoxin module